MWRLYLTFVHCFQKSCKLLFSWHHSYFRQDFQMMLAVSKGYVQSSHCAPCHILQHHCKQMSLIMRKPVFSICQNKDTDQLRGNREADQRLCFRYTDSTIPLLPKSEFQAIFCGCTARFVWDLV